MASRNIIGTVVATQRFMSSFKRLRMAGICVHDTDSESSVEEVEYMHDAEGLVDLTSSPIEVDPSETSEEDGCDDGTPSVTYGRSWLHPLSDRVPRLSKDDLYDLWVSGTPLVLLPLLMAVSLTVDTFVINCLKHEI